MESDERQASPADLPGAHGHDEFIEVRYTIPVDLHRRVQELAVQEGWPADEALLTVLSHGAAYVAGQQEVDRINCGDADVREQAEKFHSLAMSLDGSNSVMKFRAYQLGGAVQTLEWNVAGLRGENELGKRRLEIYKAEAQELKDQAAALQSENERLRGEAAQRTKEEGMARAVAAHVAALQRENKRLADELAECVARLRVLEPDGPKPGLLGRLIGFLLAHQSRGSRP